ncbi:hypothetical protein GCM10022205_05250 [Spinactinospora alkalitolerans]
MIKKSRTAIEIAAMAISHPTERFAVSAMDTDLSGAGDAASARPIGGESGARARRLAAAAWSGMRGLPGAGPAVRAEGAATRPAPVLARTVEHDAFNVFDISYYVCYFGSLERPHGAGQADKWHRSPPFDRVRTGRFPAVEHHSALTLIRASP